MKHAILMIAFHNVEFIANQLKKYDEDFLIFIHWDRKADLTDDDRKLLLSFPNVVYLDQVYSVNWASYSIVRATLELCKEALKYPGIEYLHLISDADAILKDAETFKTFFQINYGKNFINYHPYEGGNIKDVPFSKMTLFHRLEKYDIRVNLEENRSYKEELIKQKEADEYRPLPDVPIYGGSAWWSLTRECVEYLVSQTEGFTEKYYVDTIFPDESFAQTILVNSRFAETIVNDDLRYICWVYRNKNRPAVLDHTDIHPILTGGDLFARKIDPDISATLLATIDNAYFSKGIKNETCTAKEIACYLKSIDSQRIAGGLLYGHTGTLLFLLLFKEFSNDDTVTGEDIQKVLDLVHQELEKSQNDSYETGDLGMIIGLEYAYAHCPTMRDNPIMELMKLYNSHIVNCAINMDEEDEEMSKMSPYYDIYFKAREHSERLTPKDRIAWNEIKGILPVVEKAAPVSRTRNNSIGLTGYAGRGLELLGKEYGLGNSEWSFLLKQ